jgi:hypothetical protein
MLNYHPKYENLFDMLSLHIEESNNLKQAY